MAQECLLFDNAEVVLIDLSGKRAKAYNLVASDIHRIRFAKIKESSWFRQVDSEQIEIFTSKKPEPFIFTKGKHKQFFEKYKQGAAHFAKNNRITFENTTGG